MKKTVLTKTAASAILWLLLFLLPLTGIGQQFPAKPNPPRLVNDLAEVLSPDQEANLERKLVAYDDSTSNQVVILTVRTLNDYPIEEYALRILRDWGIGNQATNNGVLILAAIDDRKIRIETGYGLEGAIPDIIANTIITNDIVPSFRSENYFDGLDKATNSIIAAAAGEYQAPENYGERRGRGSGSRIPFGIIMLVIILIIIFFRNRGGGGGFMSRRGYGPIFFPGNFGGGGSSWGGGGFSGGGGGFGGFGGGSGGGGGASGSW